MIPFQETRAKLKPVLVFIRRNAMGVLGYLGVMVEELQGTRERTGSHHVRDDGAA